jgi:hypothetical protein
VNGESAEGGSFMGQPVLRIEDGRINHKFILPSSILKFFVMQFFSLEPFVPSGSEFQKSKQLFQEIGFKINWDAGDYIGFEKDGCKFILQNFTNKDFAENFMLSVKIDNAENFWKEMNEKKLVEKFGVRINKPVEQPYGIEVNMIDIAGVCWHFVE